LQITAPPALGLLKVINLIMWILYRPSGYYVDSD